MQQKFLGVFNAWVPTFNGNSLNDIQWSGPTIQLCLLQILLRFRQSWATLFANPTIVITSTSFGESVRMNLLDVINWRLLSMEWFQVFTTLCIAVFKLGNNRMRCYYFVVLCRQSFKKPWYRVAGNTYGKRHWSHPLSRVFSIMKFNGISVVQTMAGVFVSVLELVIDQSCMSVLGLGWI